MPENNSQIELRSDEVQEIMSHVPNWMIRWGISLIFVIIILFIFISWFIKYPDVVSGNVSISTENPPVEIVPKSSGELNGLNYTDGEKVTAGALLTTLKNDFSSEAKEYLELICQEIRNTKNLETIEFNDSGILFGSLQDSYNELKSLVLEYQLFLEQNAINAKIGAVRKQIENHTILRSVNYQQLNTAKKELLNAQNKYESDKRLYEKQVISKVQLYEEEKKLIQSENNVGNYKKESIQNSITITNLEQELTTLIQDKKKQETEYLSKIERSLSSIVNALNQWGKNFEIKAPINGTLAYLLPLNEHQFIEAGKPLLAIVPSNQKYIGFIDVPKQGYGKVKTGQKVRIQIDKYPSHEFGQLEGTVSNIALLPNEGVYRVTFKLNEGMRSSYGKTFEYSPEMTGKADIITDDVRLLTRIFNKFRKILD